MTKPKLRIVIGLLPLTIVACVSGTDDSGRAPVDDIDAGGSNEDVRVQPSDAAVDADAGADAEAATESPCSADGWCETALPLGDAGLDAGGDAEAPVLTMTGVLPRRANDAWAVTSEGYVLHWNGLAWTIDSATRTGASLRGIAEDASGALWAVGGQGTILRRAKGAPTWETVASPDLMDLTGVCVGEVDASHTQNLWVQSAGQISRWTGETLEDGSPVWSTYLGGENQFRSLVCDHRRVWATAQYFSFDTFNYAPRLFANDGTSNDDVGWQVDTVQFDGSSTITNVDSSWVTGASTVWLGLRTSDWQYALSHSPAQSDAAWPVTIIGPNDLFSDLSVHVWGASADDLWVVLLHGRIYHWDGAKLSVSQTSKKGIVVANDLNAVSGSVDGDVWAVGKNMALHHEAKK